jgi:hypothetical protein
MSDLLFLSFLLAVDSVIEIKRNALTESRFFFRCHQGQIPAIEGEKVILVVVFGVEIVSGVSVKHCKFFPE